MQKLAPLKVTSCLAFQRAVVAGGRGREKWATHNDDDDAGTRLLFVGRISTHSQSSGRGGAKRQVAREKTGGGGGGGEETQESKKEGALGPGG